MRIECVVSWYKRDLAGTQTNHCTSIALRPELELQQLTHVGIDCVFCEFYLQAFLFNGCQWLQHALVCKFLLVIICNFGTDADCLLYGQMESRDVDCALLVC